MDVRVTLPEDLARSFGLSGSDASEQVRFLLLLELYREGKLSFGRMAELSTLSQQELLTRMAAHGTYLNYSAQDLEEDRRSLP
jgi:predicted HTH domain antitoxin